MISEVITQAEAGARPRTLATSWVVTTTGGDDNTGNLRPSRSTVQISQKAQLCKKQGVGFVDAGGEAAFLADTCTSSMHQASLRSSRMARSRWGTTKPHSARMQRALVTDPNHKAKQFSLPVSVWCAPAGVSRRPASTRRQLPELKPLTCTVWLPRCARPEGPSLQPHENNTEVFITYITCTTDSCSFDRMF